MAALRAKRNSFVHGRWGIHGQAQQIINITPGMPGSVPQCETPLSLSELQEELADVERSIERFYEVRKRWRI
jgi:hypothetical protein